MAEFSVNAQRFDPYKNFKFRVKWDGRYVAGVSKVERPQAHHRGGQAPRGRRSLHQPQVARPDRVRGHHPRARRHPRRGVRALGQQGLELRLGLGAEVSLRTSARTSPSRSTTRPASSPSPTTSSAAGCPSSRPSPTSTPTPTRSPSRPQAGERGLGARLRGHRAARADLHRAAGLAMADADLTLATGVWREGMRARQVRLRALDGSTRNGLCSTRPRRCFPPSASRACWVAVPRSPVRPARMRRVR